MIPKKTPGLSNTLFSIHRMILKGVIFGKVSKLRRMVLKYSDKRVKLIRYVRERTFL